MLDADAKELLNKSLAGAAEEDLFRGSSSPLDSSCSWEILYAKRLKFQREVTEKSARLNLKDYRQIRRHWADTKWV